MTTEKQQKEKFRVVLDTNVYISVFTSTKGELGVIWEHAPKGTYTLLISPAIVAELANVLREKFMWPEEAIKAMVKRFARIASKTIQLTTTSSLVPSPAELTSLYPETNGTFSHLKSTRGCPLSGR